MPEFTFDLPPDFEPDRSPERMRQADALLAKIRRVEEAARLEQEEEARRASQPKSRVVTLRMPIEQIEALDQVAVASGINRGLLLRQLAADFINYIKENGIEFRGSLLRFRHDPRRDV